MATSVRAKKVYDNWSLDDSVQVRIEIGSDALCTSYDEISRKKFLLVECVNGEEIARQDVVLNVSVLLQRKKNNWHL